MHQLRIGCPYPGDLHDDIAKGLARNQTLFLWPIGIPGRVPRGLADSTITLRQPQN
jgi:hypothetical protein